MNSKRQKWFLHFCLLDAECRTYTGLWRVHLNTPWWHVAVALRPGDRFARVPEGLDWVTCHRW